MWMYFKELQMRSDMPQIKMGSYLSTNLYFDIILIHVLIDADLTVLCACSSIACLSGSLYLQ